MLLLGFIPLFANHVIESNLVENLYLNDNELVYDNEANGSFRVLDKRSRELKERNFEIITSNIEMIMGFILVASLGVVVVSNFGPQSARGKVVVRGISFIIVVLFLMPIYGDKHPNYGGAIHGHFIWEGKSSYVHIH